MRGSSPSFPTMFGDVVHVPGSMVSLESFPNDVTRKRHPDLSGDSKQPDDLRAESLMLLSAERDIAFDRQAVVSDYLPC